MKTLARQLWTEPALFLSSLAAIVNAVQVAALDLPTWAHTLIAVVSILLAGVSTRQRVSPLKK